MINCVALAASGGYTTLWRLFSWPQLEELEQRWKSMKMPSGSESMDSRIWSTMVSGLEETLAAEGGGERCPLLEWRKEPEPERWGEGEGEGEGRRDGDGESSPPSVQCCGGARARGECSLRSREPDSDAWLLGPSSGKAGSSRQEVISPRQEVISPMEWRRRPRLPPPPSPASASYSATGVSMGML